MNCKRFEQEILLPLCVQCTSQDDVGAGKYTILEFGTLAFGRDAINRLHVFFRLKCPLWFAGGGRCRGAYNSGGWAVHAACGGKRSEICPAVKSIGHREEAL